MTDVLLVFVREPVPGRAKTRLAPLLGRDDAAALYAALAQGCLAATRNPARLGVYERLVFHTPDSDPSALAAWLPGETLVPQEGADLGERMTAAFAAAFRRGGSRVVLIGSDIPGLTRHHVLDAFAALDRCNLVLGPARDGGYYLVALDRPQPGLFSSIAWSSASVLAVTAEKAAVAGLSIAMIDELGDVDTPEDLRREWPLVAPLLDEPLRRRVDAKLSR